ncbi:MAG: hypothetical protein ISR65_11650 [Bacteriovoracaceae bacterium]|nr:hypothetical protein [Bacteriovoracaceae bacterium]
MKTATIKNILAVVIFSFLLAACGGDDNQFNSKDSTSDNALKMPPLGDIRHNPVNYLQNVYFFEDFRDRVCNGNFYNKWYPSMTFHNDTFFFAEIVDDWGLIRYSEFGEVLDGGYFNRVDDYGVITHPNGPSDGSVETSYQAIAQKVCQIAYRAISSYPMWTGNTGYDAAFLMEDDNGIIYGIDLNQPIVANPVFYYNTNTGEGSKYTIWEENID